MPVVGGGALDLRSKIWSPFGFLLVVLLLGGGGKTSTKIAAPLNNPASGVGCALMSPESLFSLAGRGGEGQVRDVGGHLGILAVPSYSLVCWSNAGRPSSAPLLDAPPVGAAGSWEIDGGSDYLVKRCRFGRDGDDLFLPLLAGRGGEGEGEKMVVVAGARCFLLRANFLRLLPPSRGRLGIRGGSFGLNGVGEDSSIGLLWRWEVAYSSITSAASFGRPTSFSLVMDSGGYSISFVRPLLRLVPVYYGGSAASGYVPASGLDDGASGL